jgi:GntR family transcriptional regulator
MLEGINVRSRVAVYLQVENHVQYAIASGKLKHGDQLPSVRELSERLGVNPNTVAKSYRDLEVMGLLYTRRGMGVFINEGVRAKCKEECNKKIFAKLHEVISEAKASGLSKKDIMEVFGTSFPLAGSPYGDTPDQILKLARSKK